MRQNFGSVWRGLPVEFNRTRAGDPSHPRCTRAASGFLSFNFHQIVRVSHAHISIAHEHRSHVFCSFTKDCEDEKSVTGSKRDLEQANQSDASTSSQGNSSTATPWIMVAPSRQSIRGSNYSAVPEGQVEEVTKVLSSRVCGQPAIDGYAHVKPECLETSPTAKWWSHFYKHDGRQSELVVHIEKQADYDGLAVKWGLTNKVASAEECAKQCLDFKVGVIQEGPASPEVNYRGTLPDSYRKRHPTAPDAVQWVSGVLLPAGIKPTNGTYGP
eukprot:gene2395-8703_t